MTTQTDNLVSKEVAREINEKLIAYAQELLSEHGLKVTKTRANYGDLYKITIEATAVQMSEDGIDMGSEYVVRYQRNSHYGMAGDRFVQMTAPVGTRFELRGKIYALVGTRARGAQKIIAKEVGTDRYITLNDEIIPTINKAHEA